MCLKSHHIENKVEVHNEDYYTSVREVDVNSCNIKKNFLRKTTFWK